MVTYWFGAVRRVSPGGVALGTVVGVPMGLLVLLEDGGTWGEAASSVMLGAHATYLLWTLLVPLALTWRAVRVARRCGVPLDDELLELPCVREVRGQGKPGATAPSVMSELLERVREAEGVRIERISAGVGGGEDDEAALLCRGAGDRRVAARVRVAVEGAMVTVTVETRPVTSWVTADGGASWDVAYLLGVAARAALR